jgi:hypothetical protein
MWILSSTNAFAEKSFFLLYLSRPKAVLPFRYWIMMEVLVRRGTIVGTYQEQMEKHPTVSHCKNSLVYSQSRVLIWLIDIRDLTSTFHTIYCALYVPVAGHLIPFAFSADAPSEKSNLGSAVSTGNQTNLAASFSWFFLGMFVAGSASFIVRSYATTSPSLSASVPS